MSSLLLFSPVTENGAGDAQRSSSPANYVRNVSTPTSTAYIQQSTAESRKCSTVTPIIITLCTPCTHPYNWLLYRAAWWDVYYMLIIYDIVELPYAMLIGLVALLSLLQF